MTDYNALINAASQQYNVDPRLTRAVIQTESSMNPNAYNPSTGAAGLGQLIPSTAQALGVSNPYDPQQAVPATAQLLAEDMRRYGNPVQAVEAYHGGTNPQNWGPKTQAYVQKVGEAFQGQLMNQSDPLDQMLAAKAERAPSGQQAPPLPASASDPLDTLLAQHASGQIAHVPNVPRGTPWQTGDIAGQEAAIEAQMTPQERAAAHRTFQGLQNIGSDLAWPQQGQSWLHEKAAGLVQGIGDIGMTLGKGARLVGSGLGLESDADLGAYMRGVQAEEQAYERARQAAVPQNLSGLITGQKPSPGIDWGRIVGQIAGGGGVEGAAEDLGALGVRGLERLGYRPMVSVPTQTASRMATAATNVAKGAGTAAAASSQSDLGVGSQSLLGGAAGLVLPPVLSRTLAPVAGAIGNAANRVLGRATPTVTADAANQIAQNEASNVSAQANQASASVLNAIKTDAQGNTIIDKASLPSAVRTIFDNPKFSKLTPEQQARLLRYEALGVNSYTLSDVTRNAADQMTERNLANNANLGTAFRASDASKNNQLLAAADPQKIVGVQAPSDAAMGSGIRQALIGQRQALNQQIQDAYAQADAQAGNAPRVDMRPVIKALQQNRSQFLASQEGGGLLNGIRARMQDFIGGPPASAGKPLIVDTNGNPLLNEADIPKQMTFSDSERFRQYLNSVYDPDSDINKTLIGTVKNAVDAAQDQAGSGKIYQDARQLRQFRSQQFENPSSIQKILAVQKGGDYRMPDEDVAGYFTSGAGSELHLKQLVNQLNQTPQGQQVVNQLRAHTLQSAVTNATSNVPGESGGGLLSGARLSSQFDKIGQGRMNTLFTPDQQNYLGSLRRAAMDLTTSPPVRNPYNPSGTSAQGINMLDYLANNPSQGSTISRLMNAGANAAPSVGAGLGATLGHGIGAAIGAAAGQGIKKASEKAAARAAEAATTNQGQTAINPLQAILRLSLTKDDQIKQAVARRLLEKSAIAGGAIIPAGDQ
jgi:hypothetical protein